MFRQSRHRALLIACLALLVTTAVVTPKHTAANGPLPALLLSDACAADGNYQYAVEGYYILWDENTCQYVWHVDLCASTANSHSWCTQNLSIKHWSVMYGDPTGPDTCGPPSLPDTAQGFQYHKRTLL